MNWRKSLFLVAAIAGLGFSPGCNLLGLYVIKIVGIYEAVDSANSPAGGRVEAYSLNDDGTQTPVSGEIGTGRTGREGYFVLYLFKKIQNLIIEITQNGETTKCTLTDVQQGAQTASSLPAASLKIAPAVFGDNKTIYVTVNTESALATDLLLEEVRQEGIPPDQVSLYDIGEMLDAGIAAQARGSIDLYPCLIHHIGMARRSSRLLFITILEDANLNFETVPNADAIIKAALAQIEAVRKEYAKKIFKARKSGADSDQIDALLKEQRRKVLGILAAAGIPPQLYMKAGLIAEAEFERSLNTAAADCEFPFTLRYRLIQRALVRKAQEAALQTQDTLLQIFSYDGSDHIDTALGVFLSAIRQLPEGGNNRAAIRTALLSFNGALLNEMRAAVQGTSIPGSAIPIIYSAIQAESRGLEIDLAAAKSSADVQIAFENFYDAIRPTVFKNLAIIPSDPPELAAQKKAIADLLFTLGT